MAGQEIQYVTWGGGGEEYLLSNTVSLILLLFLAKFHIHKCNFSHVKLHFIAFKKGSGTKDQAHIFLYLCCYQ